MPSDADWVSEYGPPVDQLLTVGETPARKLKWPDYLTYGFTREDLPELMRMVADPRFDMLDSENVAVWAPLHAWRVLGQLRAEEAIETLISLFSRADDDDWVQSDLPKAIALVGPPAVPALAEYLLQGERGIWARVAAAATLVEIAGAFPGAREACVSALIEALKGYETNSPLFNGCLISDLTIDLHALEALPAIREAFARHCVDTSIMGGLREVELELG